MASERRLRQLSKTISYILRHAPWEYELELDDDGWVSIEELLAALRLDKKEWSDLSETDLMELTRDSSKQRHDIKDGKIRALYGHSTPDKLIKIPAEPPEFLYHGTLPETAAVILKEGLKPMNRQYVHLSIDVAMAKQVGNRKSGKPDILVVRANEAYRKGAVFYKGNEHVWLADYVPSIFIEQEK